MIDFRVNYIKGSMFKIIDLLGVSQKDYSGDNEQMDLGYLEQMHCLHVKPVCRDTQCKNNDLQSNLNRKRKGHFFCIRFKAKLQEGYSSI